MAMIKKDYFVSRFINLFFLFNLKSEGDLLNLSWKHFEKWARLLNQQLKEMSVILSSEINNSSAAFSSRLFLK